MKKAKIYLSLFSTFIGLSGIAQEKESQYIIEHVQEVNHEVYQLVFNPTNQRVYVAGPKQGFNRNVDNYIYVLDASDLSIQDSISVGRYLPFGIALNNTTQTLYVGHSLENAISAIDLKTKKQTLIPNGKEKSKIREIVVDEKHNKVYVSDHGNPSIWQIDGATNTYLRALEEPNAYLLGLNVDPERNRVYGTDGQNMKGHVLVFDTETGALEGRFKTWSYCPMNIALDLVSNRIFVSQQSDNNITVLDGNTGEILHKTYVGFGSSPIGVIYDTARNRIFTAGRNSNDVIVIDATTYEVLERIPTEGLPNTLSLDPATGTVYVTNKTAGRNGDPVKNGNTVQKIILKKS